MAGGPSESIWQPEWSPEGVLHFVSDRSGWWNLYREDAQLTDERAELGYPQWGFGGSSYAFLDGGDIACIRVEGGYERLCILRPGQSDPEDLGLPYTAVGYPELRSDGDRVIYAAKSPAEEGVVVSWSATDGVRVLSEAGEHALAPEWAPGARGDRVPERRRSHRARVLVPAEEPRLRGAARRAAADHRAEPRRAHLRTRSPSSTRRSPSGRAAGSAWWT